MTCSVEGCDRPIDNAKRGWCRKHYMRWYRYGSTDARTGIVGPCSFEGCPRPSMKKYPVCEGHRNQQRLGRELTPIGSLGGSNKSTKICKHEACDRTCKKYDYCHPHQWQYKTYGITWDLGSPNPRKVVEDVYSDTKTCATCGETKPWRRFVMGTDDYYDMCRDCHRAKLSKQATEPLVPHHSTRANKNMEDLLDFLANRTK